MINWAERPLNRLLWTETVADGFIRLQVDGGRDEPVPTLNLTKRKRETRFWSSVSFLWVTHPLPFLGLQRLSRHLVVGARKSWVERGNIPVFILSYLVYWHNFQEIPINRHKKYIFSFLLFIFLMWFFFFSVQITTIPWDLQRSFWMCCRSAHKLDLYQRAHWKMVTPSIWSIVCEDWAIW